MMLDIAGQLVAKWWRLNADDEIDVARDMTLARGKLRKELSELELTRFRRRC
jgi:hypothetical protein